MAGRTNWKLLKAHYAVRKLFEEAELSLRDKLGADIYGPETMKLSEEIREVRLATIFQDAMIPSGWLRALEEQAEQLEVDAEFGALVRKIMNIDTGSIYHSLIYAEGRGWVIPQDTFLKAFFDTPEEAFKDAMERM